jgi:Fic family protein
MCVLGKSLYHYKRAKYSILHTIVMVIELRVIKRSKGTGEYFYLQHSYRKQGKVVTKEVYLGKVVPENIEEIKAKLAHESHEALAEKLEKIRDNFQKEWRKTPQAAREKELQEIAIAFTYNTNAIEGSTITQEEVRLILDDKVAPTKPLRDIRETESHAATFLQMLKMDENLSKILLLRWHESIFKDTKPDIAGKFRDYAVRVGPHVAPDWRKVDMLLEQLVVFANTSRLNPVEVAARAHYMFEKVHPFGDGNGRIGRLLMNFVLWRNGYPMLVVEYKKRQSYYKALNRTEEGFANYFIRRYLATHKILATA